MRGPEADSRGGRGPRAGTFDLVMCLGHPLERLGLRDWHHVARAPQFAPCLKLTGHLASDTPLAGRRRGGQRGCECCLDGVLLRGSHFVGPLAPLVARIRHAPLQPVAIGVDGCEDTRRFGAVFWLSRGRPEGPRDRESGWATSADGCRRDYGSAWVPRRCLRDLALAAARSLASLAR
jgi:hypothetical protein